MTEQTNDTVNTTDKRSNELKQAEQWLNSLTVHDIVNNSYLDVSKLDNIKQQYNDHKPYRLIVLDIFLDSSYAIQLRNELLELNYYIKKNDLYHFMQSNDLTNTSDRIRPLHLIDKIVDILYSNTLRQSLSYITGIELSEHTSSVSVSAAIYADTHHLLCHDDELQGRRIAYILYMLDDTAGPWTIDKGGLLQIYNTDSQGHPCDIVKEYIPKFNTMILFEVTEHSYHRVSEVITKLHQHTNQYNNTILKKQKLNNDDSKNNNDDDDDEMEHTPESTKLRLSISGWYHGQPVVRQTLSLPAQPTLYQPADSIIYTLDDYINADYLNKKKIKTINKKFIRESYIQLNNFLKQDIYNQLYNELNNNNNNNIQWQHMGPANWRSYNVAQYNNDNKASCISYQLQQLFTSNQFVDYITKLTGLDISTCNGNIRQFKHSDYTLAHDHDPEIKLEGLDLNLCIIDSNVTEWNSEQCGGSIHYIEAGETDELLCIEPQHNTLTLIYRTGVDNDNDNDNDNGDSNDVSGVLRFVKYFNHYVPCNKYDIDVLYRPVQDNDSSDSENSDNNDS